MGWSNFYLPGYVTTGGVTRTFTRVSKRIKDRFSSRNDDVIGAAVIVRPDIIAALADLIGALPAWTVGRMPPGLLEFCVDAPRFPPLKKPSSPRTHR